MANTGISRDAMLKLALPRMRRLSRELGQITKHYKETDREIILNEVWDRMCDGQILADILPDIGLPARTYYNWLDSSPAFGNAHARAKARLADWAFGEAYRVPRDMLAKIRLGDPVDNTEVTASANLTKSLQWYAERLDPRNYGQQKQELKVTGELSHTHQAIPLDVTSLTSEQRDALRLALLATKEQDNQELRESGKLIEARALPSPKPAKE